MEPLRYCPDDAVTREQMAVFLLKAKHGAAAGPPGGHRCAPFDDVRCIPPFASWIAGLLLEGVAAGSRRCCTAPRTQSHASRWQSSWSARCVEPSISRRPVLPARPTVPRRSVYESVCAVDRRACEVGGYCRVSPRPLLPRANRDPRRDGGLPGAGLRVVAAVAPAACWTSTRRCAGSPLRWRDGQGRRASDPTCGRGRPRSPAWARGGAAAVTTLMKREPASQAPRPRWRCRVTRLGAVARPARSDGACLPGLCLKCGCMRYRTPAGAMTAAFCATGRARAQVPEVACWAAPPSVGAGADRKVVPMRQNR